MEIKEENEKSKYVFFVILLLTFISSQIISDFSIKKNVPMRIGIQDSIIIGQYEAPYQYRILKPVLGKSINFFVSRFVRDPEHSHVVSYQILISFVFLGIFTLFYFYLKLFFSVLPCIIGLLLIQIVIPLGITSIWEEGDYITLLFYLIGFNLMFRSKDYLLPVVILLGVLNRDQIIYIIVFYIAFLIGEKRLFTKRSIFIIALCIAAYFTAYFSMRLYFGFKINQYVTEIQTSTNITHWKGIMGLWAEQVFIYVVLAIISYKKSSTFFRLSLISLILYVGIFFFNSILSQVAKILPAYLILIPMGLQTLTGEKMKYYHNHNQKNITD
ncbi:MAG: hypothetical protein LH629_04885 [Ignavibacteria bacterium]|nr:hypothetical protein [Ignavibacteria bacterium]